jgi:hypothetical protein
VDDGPLNDPLETRGRFGLFAMSRNEVQKLIVDEAFQGTPQRFQIDAAGPHDSRRILVVDEGQQEMFERGILMMALIGEGQGAVKSFF